MKKIYKALIILLALLIGGQSSLMFYVKANESETAMERGVILSIPQNLKAKPNGNGVVNLTWDSSTLSNASGDISYLIYRSETKEGEFKKIGFNSKGRTYFNDIMPAGETKYYRVLAYINLDKEYTSAFSNIVNCTSNNINLENEFFTTADAVDYLKTQMENRAGTIEFTLWHEGAISGYSKQLYNQAIEDKEDLSVLDTAVGGDYLFAHLLGYDCELFDHRLVKDGKSRYTFTYTFKYYTNKSEETQANNAAKEIIKGFGLASNATTEQKVRAVYEYLSKNVTYDLSPRNGKGRTSAYDALVQKKAVCQGYSNATYTLLRAMGVNNRIVMGHVIFNGENRVHAWNIVEMNGKWYNVDSTIGAEVFMINKSYDYRGYLKSTKDFSTYILDTEYKTSKYIAEHPMTSTSIKEPANIGKVVISSAKLQNGEVKLIWDKLDNARGYNIFRSEQDGTGFKQIGAVMGNASFVDKEVVIGKNYLYKIKPYNKANGTTNVGEFSNEVKIITLPVPADLKTVSVGNDRVHLSWESVNTADGYYVYQYDVAQKKYKRIAITTSTDYQHYNLTANRNYSYAVLAYSRSDKTYYSNFSNESSAKTAEVTKLISVDTMGSNSVRLEWNIVSGSVGYNLYRADFRVDGKYDFTYLKGTSSTSITDSTAEKGKKYIYMIKPFTKVNGTTFYSDPSNYGVVTTMMANITSVENLGTSLKVNWTATGTQSYNLYRYDNKTGNYVYIKSISNANSYTDTDVVPGEQYYYKLRPYTRVNNKVYYGDYSNGKSSVALSSSKLSYTTNGKDVTLVWDKSVGARGYNIYRSTTINGRYEYVTGTSSATYKVSTQGKDGYYKIRPYQKFDNNVYYADYSNSVNLGR